MRGIAYFLVLNLAVHTLTISLQRIDQPRKLVYL
jgi:hypothetical protein